MDSGWVRWLSRWCLRTALLVRCRHEDDGGGGDNPCSGLEYLTMIDQLMIKQKVEMLEAVAGVMGYGLETSNKYRIKNVLGQVSVQL